MSSIAQRHVHRARGNGMWSLRARVHGLRRAANTARLRGTGRRLAVVNDIDNTETDARGRTLAALVSYASRHRLPLPSQLTLASMAFDGRGTAERLGWSAAHREAFHAYWSAFFWHPKSLAFDAPIRPIIALTKRAAENAEVFHLTGRDTSLRAATLRQLERLGIPYADEQHLLTKSPGQSTDAFKREQLERLLAEGYDIRWFLTDTGSEMLAAGGLPVRPVYIDFAVRASDEQKPHGVPTIRLR